jgi:methyl-accepting chemotaxis protein
MGRQIRCPSCKQVFQLPEARDLVPLTDLERVGPESYLRDLDAVALVDAGGRTAGWDRLLFGDGTNVNLVLSLTLAVACTVLFYAALVYPMFTSRFGQLFGNRTYVQHVSTFLFFWAVVILVWKYYLLRRQRTALQLQVLPVNNDKITLKNVDIFLAHVSDLAQRAGAGFLLRRVWRALEHFRVTGHRSDVAAQLASQAEIDATSAAGSYTIVKVCLGAIPIVGFIGTCYGIGLAVYEFSSGLQAAANIEAIKESLSKVTSGLYTGFDTTLLALVLSVIVLFLSSWSEKSEEAVLNAVEEYCNEKVLRRLGDDTTTTPPATLGPTELRTFMDRLNNLSESLLRTTVQGWQLASSQQLQQVQKLHESLTAEMAKVGHSLSEQAGRFEQQLAQQQQQHLQQLQQLVASQAEIRQGMQAAAAAVRQAAGSLESVQPTVTGISQAADKLSSAATRLAQVNDARAAASRGHGFLGWFRSSR